MSKAIIFLLVLLLWSGGVSAQAAAPSISSAIDNLTNATIAVKRTNSILEHVEIKFASAADKDKLAMQRIKLADLLWSTGQLRLPNAATRDVMKSYLTDPTEDGWLRARYVFNETLVLVRSIAETLKSFKDPRLEQITTSIELRGEILTTLLAMPVPSSPKDKALLADLYVAYDRLAKELVRQNDLMARLLKTSAF